MNIPPEYKKFTCITHPHLNANGSFLHNPISQPPPISPPGFDSQNPWAPFSNRLEHDWAHYHYIQLQSSVEDIAQGLDLWHAVVITHASKPDHNIDVPWRTAADLYETIDAIQIGAVGWKTFKFHYSGPKPPTPPQWMENTYKLNARDVLAVVEQQMASSEFNSQFEYTPYQEYNSNGDHIYSHLMSGYWANHEADTISQDESTHGAMLVGIVSGSDKTTVSVVTGHQEYHPVYASAANISNTAWHEHGNAVVPVAFLPIPKTSKCQQKKPEFQRFCQQLYHACLEIVFAMLKPYLGFLGSYIADYPEQVWLSAVVSNWCPKCNAHPENLDGPGSHCCSHEKTDFLIKQFDTGVLWDEFGIQNDVVPFTHGFPCADIHELMAPDLLHQLIKGTFKDHLVEWVIQYLHITHDKTLALEIIEDIDHHILAVPPFPGLCQFPDGHDYTQWTGDDSKALMKVFVAAITGYLPSAMVCCITTFMDACYIACHNAITSLALKHFKECVDSFHHLCTIIIATGVRATISLPHQHALKHFHYAIQLFGSPNGLCSLITESKHIKAVREPCFFLIWHMLIGSTTSYMAGVRAGHDSETHPMVSEDTLDDEPDDEVTEPGNPSEALFDVKLASKPEPGYPHDLECLATSFAIWQFLYCYTHPGQQPLQSLEECPQFDSKIKVYHSAISIFYAPSDLSEVIRSNPSFCGNARMRGMEISQVLLFFSFTYCQKSMLCALVNWFVYNDKPDPDTGMWVVELECDCQGLPTLQVPNDFNYHDALNRFNCFFINHFIDHHAHEFLHNY
ncbi:hypothetical protein BDQ12DRAFT_701098 [Crucibulum laeve]|uniref:Uncharacterized protein n=1 Tax=Crucibulum laeve TaxID=68775 RepID=A0A5C3LIR5_9AGAR|nr:hypothetical protein BDQ12DRAFT_701098 [Crucibulum laeve]